MEGTLAYSRSVSILSPLISSHLSPVSSPKTSPTAHRQQDLTSPREAKKMLAEPLLLCDSPPLCSSLSRNVNVRVSDLPRAMTCSSPPPPSSLSFAACAAVFGSYSVLRTRVYLRHTVTIILETPIATGPDDVAFGTWQPLVRLLQGVEQRYLGQQHHLCLVIKLPDQEDACDER